MRRLLDWLRWKVTGERDLAEEIRAHLEIETDRLVAEDGFERADAERVARRRFGNLLHASEDSAAIWGFGRLESWVQDARFGLRLLARDPLFTFVTIGSLSIGMGAGIANFGLLDAILLRQLPVEEPGQLVLFRWTAPAREELPAESINGWLDLDDGGRKTSTSFSYPAYEAMRAGQKPLTELFAFAGIERVLVRTGAASDVTTGQYVSGNYFAGLGIEPAAGRALGPDDDHREAEPAVMISYEGWQRRFGGASSVIGARVALNQVPVTIVGVTPRGFHGCLQVGSTPEFTLPMAMQPSVTPRDGGMDDQGYWWVQVMGRLRPGFSSADAAAELGSRFDRHVASLPVPAGVDLGMPTLKAGPGGLGLMEQRKEFATPLRFLTVLVVLVLLAAAANVAGLLLARATARAREMSIRLAIGAGRARLARQAVIESLLLALLGGAGGLLAVTWLLPLLQSAAQPRAATLVAVPFRVDARLAGFALGLSVVVGVLLGLFTLAGGARARLSLTRAPLNAMVEGRPRLGLGKVLVASQVAFSLLFVILAGLFAGTLRNLHRVETGVDVEQVLSFRVEPGLQGYEGPRRAGLLRAALDRMQALPGVRAAGFSRNALFTGSSAIVTIHLPGEAKPAAANVPAMAGAPIAWAQSIGGRFLEALGMPLVTGRRFEARDAEGAPRVALANRAFAKAYFGREDVVGKTFATSRDGPPIEIVGVVGDARYTDLRQEPPPTIYLPFAQRLATFEVATFYVRTTRGPEAVAAEARRALRELDPALPVLEVQALERQVDRSMERERRVALTSSFFGVLTVLLACIGLYGIMAYAVSRRTRELGVRLALGASPGRLVADVLRETGTVVGAGLALGVAAALAGGRLVEAELYGVRPTDAPTLAAAAALVAALALAAGYLPARRAARVDPLVALRSE